MSRFSVIRILISVILFANGAAQAPAFPLGTLVCTNEDYAIFAAALDDLYDKQKVHGAVILDRTSIGIPPGLVGATRLAGRVESFLKEVPKEAKDDYDVRNKNVVQIEVDKIKARFETFSLSPEDAERLVRRKDGWEAFHERFSEAFGISVLSLPGINHARNRSVVYVGAACGPLCGGGTLLLLSKESGEWKVTNAVTVWQS